VPALNENNRIHARAVDSDCLNQRILKNTGNQKIDFIEWIFSRIRLEPGSKVLELCSGTGNQTLRMIEGVGEEGFVVATDISEKALNHLRSKVDQASRTHFRTVTAPMDELPAALEESGLAYQRYDLVFCAYGLYYSENPIQVLEGCVELLEDGGRIVIAGPFGPNNAPLFRMLEDSGVAISDYVKYTSQDFMEESVIPFACRRFGRSTIHTLVNPVQWKSPDDVMQYWRNTTFFDEGKSSEVESSIRHHFRSHDVFLNEKWIMMVEMADIMPLSS